jgi:hypothetical protein
MLFLRLATIAFASGLAIIFGAEGARASDDDCTFKTRSAVVSDLTHEGVEGVAKAMGTGLLLIAARTESAPVKIGSALLFAVEALGLTRTSAQAAELPLKGDPNQMMRICQSEGAFANALGFRTLSIVSTEPKAADLFQAKIHQDFDRPSGLSGLTNPTLSLDALSAGQTTPSAGATWDDRAVDNVLMQFRSAPKPIFQAPSNTPPLLSLPPAKPPPSRSFDLSAPPRAVTVTGEVVDDATDRAVDQGVVRVSTASDTSGLWQTVMIDRNGRFSTDLPPGSYVASATVPGYPPIRRSFTLTANEAGHDLEFRLPHQSPYPCSFTVVNNTGWSIELFMGNTKGPIEMVEPWSNAQFTVNRPFNIGPQAEFSNGPPVLWPPMPADCNGPGVAYLDP